jgi:hypothetical protein
MMVTGPSNPDGRGSVKSNDLMADFVVKVYLPVIYSLSPNKPFSNFTFLKFASGSWLSSNKRLIQRFATAISSLFSPSTIAVEISITR